MYACLFVRIMRIQAWENVHYRLHWTRRDEGHRNTYTACTNLVQQCISLLDL